jgi:ethanolamine utilization protein EutA
MSGSGSDTGGRATQRPHTLADHALGAFAGHVHGDGAHDHDHDHDAMDGLLVEGESGHVALTSIGIDVGSSGTQIAFSRLFLEHAHGPADTDARGRLQARSRDALYQSPISLTPFDDNERIDEDRLGAILDHAFTTAGLSADDIDCGVVILTGAARERANAETICHRLALQCGDIVSASAGHLMEARLAAHGSGAAQRSLATGKRFLNIDIGGATTKLAVCEAGRVIAAAALAIGGRLVATDTHDRIVRLDESGRRYAARCGIAWTKGSLASFDERKRVGIAMADDLVTALTVDPMPDDIRALFLTTPLAGLDAIDAIVVSGGVGEYVYGRERRSFGDLGLPLGRALAARIDRGALPWPLMPASECIRATVLGASSYSVQLSGRTGCITNAAALLPRRNCRVVRPALDLGREIAAEAVAATIRDHIVAFDIAADEPDVVLAIGWSGAPDHARLKALADGIAGGLADRLSQGQALNIILDGDVAASLGAILRDEIGISGEILVLDGIPLEDFDYVDLGRIRLPSGTVPVTIKTLVFREEPRQISLPGTTRAVGTRPNHQT